jgi:hypothetical protein
MNLRLCSLIRLCGIKVVMAFESKAPRQNLWVGKRSLVRLTCVFEAFQGRKKVGVLYRSKTGCQVRPGVQNAKPSRTLLFALPMPAKTHRRLAKARSIAHGFWRGGESKKVQSENTKPL